MKTRLLCIIALSLIISGCHGDNDNAPTGPGTIKSVLDPLQSDPDDTTLNTPDPEPATTVHFETSSPSSCGNPTGAGCRENSRFDHPGSYYGTNVKVYADGVLKMTVPDASQRKEGSNGIIWKPVGNTGGAVFVGEYGKKIKECKIEYKK